jgi:hypothetical protein
MELATSSAVKVGTNVRVVRVKLSQLWYELYTRVSCEKDDARWAVRMFHTPMTPHDSCWCSAAMMEELKS